jgi:hypothetical protein
LNPKGTDMYLHPDHIAMVACQQHRDMLAAAERARLVRQATLLAPAKPRRSRILLALARARGDSGVRIPGPVPTMPAA